VTRVLLALLLAGLLLGVSPAAQARGEDPFLAGEPYRGTFADPTVMVVGDTYVAAGTTTANLNLPLMTSTDLVTWRPREALPDWQEWSRWSGYNEGMVRRPAWAAVKGWRDDVPLVSQWAPSLAKVGGRYVAAFSAAVTLEPRHSCIGVATAKDPVGPYVPRSRPLVCYPRAPLGAIDPDLFLDPRSGAAYLVWKNEGVPGLHPPRLVSRRLDARRLRFASGSRTRVLLTRSRPWEGGVVENPSMVRHRGRYLLVYSANAWRTGGYKTGYALCRGPVGPCTKSPRPLMSTGGGATGPGGADAFVDAHGILRLAYHSWDDGLRRLRVATLGLSRGVLRLLGRG
jgi:beta-xylosidase